MRVSWHHRATEWNSGSLFWFLLTLFLLFFIELEWYQQTWSIRSAGVSTWYYLIEVPGRYSKHTQNCRIKLIYCTQWSRFWAIAPTKCRLESKRLPDGLVQWKCYGSAMINLLDEHSKSSGQKNISKNILWISNGEHRLARSVRISNLLRTPQTN